MRRLWDEGLLRSLPDLYRLTPEALLEVEGYAEISAANAIAAIQASKAVPFRRVLFGLNIPDVGWVTAQNLARHFGSVDRLIAAAPEELVECEGIGPERAEAIAEWFADEDNLALLAELRELGLVFESDEGDRPKEGPLSGRQYVITGTLESLDAGGGDRCARGARGEGLRQRLEEDDRRLRRREPGCVEALEGGQRPACRSSTRASSARLLAAG